MQIKVEGTTFYRDSSTTALVNRDASGLQEYKTKRKLLETQRQEINTVKQEMESIKCDVLEIKELMRQLLNSKGSNG